MNGQEFEAVQARLKKMERVMRLTAVAWVLIALVVGLLGFATFQTSPERTYVRARAVDIVDQAGKRRIALGVTSDGGTVVRLYDAAEKERLGLFAAPDGGTGMVLFGAGGQERLSVHVLPIGTPGIRLSDPEGQVLFAAP